MNKLNTDETDEGKGQSVLSVLTRVPSVFNS